MLADRTTPQPLSPPPPPLSSPVRWLRGGTSAYTPLNEVFEKILATQPATITLNMKGLKSSDDAGKNSLYKFVIAARKQGTGLVVQGAALQPWHRELATGLKKFHNNITYAE